MSAAVALACSNLWGSPNIDLKGSDGEVRRIYLIRHGQSQLNLPIDGVKYVQGTSLNVPLTQVGEEQAKALLTKLAPRIKELDVEIVSSTALRAQQTADVFAKYLNRPLTSYAGLCELGSGPWEGKPKNQAYDAAHKKWKEMSAQEKFYAPKVEGGETPEQVTQRSMADLSKAVSAAAEGKTLLVFSHDMTMNLIAFKLSKTPFSDQLGTELPYLDIGNCDLLMLEIPKGKGLEDAQVKALIHSDIKKTSATQS